MKNHIGKEQKAITLISLVITVIILIILSSVSITIIIGNDGIIEKTKNIKEKYNEEYINENIDLAKLNLKINNKKVNASNISNYLIQNKIVKENEIEILKDEYNEDIEIIKIQDLKFPIPIPKIIVYFEKTENWQTDNIYAYIWNPDNNESYVSYPGEKAVLVDENIYSYTVPEEFKNKKILFNNGISSGAGTMQTVDLDIPNEGGYIFCNTDTVSRDIYFIQDSWQYCNIYIWNEDGNKIKWPGESISSYKVVGTNYYYCYTLPEDYDNFIFVKMDESGNVKGQTKDFSFVGGNKVYRSDGKTSIMSNGIWKKFINF